MLSITAVTPLDDYWVRLRLSNGQEVERGLRQAIWGPVFEPLRRDYERFRRAQVRWGTVVWGRDLDLDPETLIEGRRPTTRPLVPSRASSWGQKR
jgi:hypothetical protein